MRLGPCAQVVTNAVQWVHWTRLLCFACRMTMFASMIGPRLVIAALIARRTTAQTTSADRFVRRYHDHSSLKTKSALTADAITKVQDGRSVIQFVSCVTATVHSARCRSCSGYV